MQTHRTPTLAVLILLFVPAASIAAGERGDESTIPAVLDRFEEAFEKRDATLYAGNFTEVAGVYRMFQMAIHGQRSAKPETKLPPRRVRNSSVLRKQSGDWKVVDFEATNIRTDDLPAR